MPWLGMHLRLLVGIAADCLTFGGGLILARDGFQRLKDLNESRIAERFRAQFPNLNLVDTEVGRARVSVRWVWRGMSLVALGFALQIVSRFLEGG
jgi:hypothetical protein